MKEFWCDTETTGLIPGKHHIWQLAGMIIVDGRTEIINERMRPRDLSNAGPKALEVGGVTMEELSTYRSSHEVYMEFESMLNKCVDKFNKQDKIMFYAYNARFDMDFMRAWFKENGNSFFGSYFWFPPIDVMNLAVNHLKDIRYNMKDFKQGTVAEALGIQVDESRLHDAMYDIEISKSIYEVVGK
jgi:DNA polymerase-3 subunit epsilon